MIILGQQIKCTKTFSFTYSIIKCKNRKEEKFLLAHKMIIVYNEFGGNLCQNLKCKRLVPKFWIN
ncbi:hypothetical protein E4N76_02250 [Treponema putidum]|uniref:Uncharacterized protein n=1 Tax=Treponema putidum TaxID=221027 RepID=A0AAE9MRV0_9SPIR|nr:hypothetical protein E4N76_02250 [Treponema putidum]UTY32844.1 hypothetical protein E4N74_01600 [Treponema putidum]